MAYEDLTLLNHTIPKAAYYDLVLENCEEIIDQTTEKPKSIIAKELGMSTSAFSNIFPLLLAIRRSNRKAQ